MASEIVFSGLLGSHFNFLFLKFNGISVFTESNSRRGSEIDFVYRMEPPFRNLGRLQNRFRTANWVYWVYARAPSHRETPKQEEIITGQQQSAMQRNGLQLRHSLHASTTRIAATRSIRTSWHSTMLFVSFMMDSSGSSGTNIKLVIVDN